MTNYQQHRGVRQYEDGGAAIVMYHCGYATPHTVVRDIVRDSSVVGFSHPSYGGNSV